MSLILTSKRNSKIYRNKSSILSPTSIFNDISENIHQNRAPFNSKMEKFFELTKKRNSKIGPGAYYHQRQSSFIKRSFGKKTSSMEEKNRNELYNLALYKVINTKNSLKLNAQKSLIIDKENKSQVINSNNINSYNEYNKSSSMDESKINYKLIPTTLTKNRINSIPSKEHYLGYDFDINGLPIIVDSSSTNIFNKENEEKNNLKEKKINALDWSKMSKKEIGVDSNNDITTKDNSININNNNNLTEEFYELTRSMSNINIPNTRKNIHKRNKNESISSILNNELTTEKENSSNIFSSFSNIHSPKIKNQIRYRSPGRIFSKKKKSLEEFVYDNIFKGDPGPGYYQCNSDFDKIALYKYKNKNKKFNFGSNALRNDNLSNSNNFPNLGPGSYFKENNKPKLKPDFYPLSRIEPRISMKKYEKYLYNQNVGPGKYDIKSQFDKTQFYYSGPLEKRFFDNNKKIEIGPGEYLPLYDWSKNIQKEENKINKEKSYDRNIKNDNEETSGAGRDSYIMKNENPGAGSYNPHIINSIHYDMISKENKMSNLQIPFNSAQERFLNKSQTSSDLLGPGRYFPENKNIKSFIPKIDKNKGLYKITVKADKIKNILNQEKLDNYKRLGPGSYDLHNYSEWHKKSFNAKSFIS